MRLAVLSDIHGNREALAAVIAAGRTRGVDAWLCLGDIVGYGADPRACLDAVRELTDAVLLGNHDAAAVGLQDLENFNPYARRAAEWTAEQLDDAERHYLAALPLVLDEGDALFVHAEPIRPAAWGYIFDLADAQTALAARGASLLFRRALAHPLPLRRGRGRCRASGRGSGPVPRPLSGQCRQRRPAPRRSPQGLLRALGPGSGHLGTGALPLRSRCGAGQDHRRGFAFLPGRAPCAGPIKV